MYYLDTVPFYQFTFHAFLFAGISMDNNDVTKDLIILTKIRFLNLYSHRIQLY